MAEEVFLEYEGVLAKNAPQSNSNGLRRDNSNCNSDFDLDSLAVPSSVHLSSFAGLLQWRWADVLQALRSCPSAGLECAASMPPVEKGESWRDGDECCESPWATFTDAGLQSLWQDLMGLRKQVNVVLERGRKQVRGSLSFFFFVLFGGGQCFCPLFCSIPLTL
jgi:hypothetical protein